MRARRIDDPADIGASTSVDDYMTGYARIAELAGLHPDAVRGFLAEELLDGEEVTLEGYVHGGDDDDDRRHRLGQVSGDEQLRAVRVPVGPAARAAGRARTTSIARVLPALGFDGGFFNVEFFVSRDSGPRGSSR